MIEICGKGKKKELWVDGEFFCVINDFLILKYKLPQSSLSQEKLNEIKNEAEVELGFSMAVDFVSRGSKTKKQVAEFLSKKISKVNESVVLEKLLGYHYVDDLEFAKNFVDSKKSTCGKNKIRLALIQKGVSNEDIEKALVGLDNKEQAKKIADKYMRAKEMTRQNLEKLTRHLISKGFTWDEIAAVKRSYKEKIDESWD